jgi:hypothetical protein
MTFYTLGGQDPCIYGNFCEAQVDGREWATTKGLQVGELTQRLLNTYPKASDVKEPGAIRRYVLERGVAPCGRDARGGLEAWTSGGRIFTFRITFLAGGD